MLIAGCLIRMIREGGRCEGVKIDRTVPESHQFWVATMNKHEPALRPQVTTGSNNRSSTNSKIRNNSSSK